MIDINFDFRTDCAPKKDPDSNSQKLQNYHEILWNKALPNGKIFDLKKGGSPYDYLHWNGMRFGSDTMNSTYSYTGYKAIKDILPDVPDRILEDFRYRVYTIGNFIIFPKGKGNSINQDRGSFSSCIKDRFDLTLECIRLYYSNENNEKNPLHATIQRYKDFFDLFVDFKGYVNFFLLQDLLTTDGKIKFLLGTGNFEEEPLPQTPIQYVQYIENASDFIKARSVRLGLSVA